MEKCYWITSTNANASIINSYGDVNIKGGYVYGQYNVPAIQNLGSGTVSIDADSTTTPTGYNVRSSGKPESVIANKANGKVVVKNGVIYVDNVTPISNAGYAISNTDGSTGTISVEGGTIDAGKAISNYSTAQEAVVISGGTINGQSHENANLASKTIANFSTGGIKISDNASITLKVNDKNTSDKNQENFAVYNEAGGNVSITGGTIDLQRKAVAVCNASTGTVDVSGGTLTSNDSSAKGISNTNNGTIKVSGGTITIKSNYAIENNGTVEVSGGTITGKYGVMNQSTGTVNASGGTIGASTNAIDNAGHVNVSGTAVISSTGSTKHNAGIYNKTTGIVSISGGSVTSEQFYGIFLAPNFRNKIYVSGGTVEGGTYAIYDQSTVAAAISLSDGTYNGQLATKNTNETNYTISGAPTFNSNTLLSASSTLLKYTLEGGTAGDSIIGAEGWNATETENEFFNLSTTDSIYGTKDFTLSNVTTPFNVNIDDTVKVAGVPISDVVSGATPALTAGDGGTYKLATLQYNSAKTAATVSTTEDGVSITSAVLESSVASVSGAGNSYTLYIAGGDTLKNIIGSDNADTLVAGANGSTLEGGKGDDSLVGGAGADYLLGGDGADTYIYTAGADSIEGYVMGTDVVSLGSGLEAPTSFENFTGDGSNITLNFGSSNTLTFTKTVKVSLASGDDTYTYTPTSIAREGKGITLGSSYTATRFDGTSSDNENYATINAANITKAFKIIGNDKANYIVGGTVGELLGGDNNDTIIAGGGSTTLNGEDGNDVLQGGSGKDLFFYTAGTDSIGNYSAADGDLITVRGVNLAEATVSKDTSNLILTFDSSNALSIAGGAAADATKAISIQSGKNVYTYTKDYYALNDKSVTLMSGHTSPFDGSDKSYTTINAAQANAISILGNASGNYIVGSKNGGTLNGGAGDDQLVASDERKDNAAYLFEHTGGKDTVTGFDATKDTIDIAVDEITEAKLSGDKLILTIDKKENLLALRSDDDIATVSLKDGGYLTKDGYVKDTNFKLFSSAKGRIELTSELYSGASISSLNAESVKDQSVTLVGGTQGGEFYYAANNKQKDGFEYGGGAVSISGYEGGRDKIDLGAYSLADFTVEEDNGVVLNLGEGNSISIAGAKGKEVLVHDATKSNIYQKMVFVNTGIVQTKVSKPTAAVISSTLSSSDNTYTAPPTVKKVTIDIGGVKVKAGDSKNTILDASNATTGVSLEGGKKNDKLIGGAGDDLFIYTGGKDIINGYGAGDSISFEANSFDIDSAKITASNKSIKFKFSNKNTLTIKGEDLSSLNVNGETRTYFKNAIADGGAVSLTGAFSGTFSTAGTNIATVDGHLVTKNLTFKGTEANEVFIGGSKKKTMFKGGGGADSLVGGNATDTFFYAKNDTGNATIANFDYGKDKLKVASGKISDISADEDKNVTFRMADGSFKVENTNLESGKNIAIRANNTYYWFADEDATDDSYKAGALITSADKRITAGEVRDFAVIDLNYSTNLVKANVAFKVTGATPNKTET